MSSKLGEYLTDVGKADDTCSLLSRLSVLSVLLTIHHEGHLTHGDCNDDSWRHILLRECAEGRDFRIIDFDHATSHNCGQRMDIRIDDYEPPLKDFGCMELYDAAQWLNLWTPGELTSLTIVKS